MNTYGDADVGLFQSRRVIDIVTGDRGDQMQPLTALDNLQLLHWRRSSEHNFLIPSDQLVQLLR